MRSDTPRPPLPRYASTVSDVDLYFAELELNEARQGQQLSPGRRVRHRPDPGPAPNRPSAQRVDLSAALRLSQDELRRLKRVVGQLMLPRVQVCGV